MPVLLGEADAFVSHSWHDDAEEKWDALQAWIKEFRRSKKRDPLLWIDKYCVDQTNIEEALFCLPVYLAGCKRLLVLCGNTYLKRLWCLMEIFIFLQMGGTKAHMYVELLAGRRVNMSGEDSSQTSMMRRADYSRKALEDDVRSFDPRKATCFSDADTARLRSVLAAAGGGLDGLASFIQDSFQIRDDAKGKRVRKSMAPTASIALPSRRSDSR